MTVMSLLLGGCTGAASRQEAEAYETVENEAAEAEVAADEAITDEVTADEAADDTKAFPEDGVYPALFETDSSMFHVSEACEDKGELTVKDGVMTIHVSLAGKGILNLYPGTSDEAKQDEAGWLEPVEDEVVYSDGMTEKVNGFDVPVPVLGEEFDVALIGKKGKWYDHKVKVTLAEASAEVGAEDGSVADFGDGSHKVNVTMEGGTGRAFIESPAELTCENGNYFIKLVWSSENYDYMIVDGEKYLNENEGGNSTFTISLGSSFDISSPLEVIGDTLAMSEPHEIEYTLHFENAD